MRCCFLKDVYPGYVAPCGAAPVSVWVRPGDAAPACGVCPNEAVRETLAESGYSLLTGDEFLAWEVLNS